MTSAQAQPEIDVELRLLVLETASSTETADDLSALPGQICEARPGESFVLELWASDVGSVNTGIVGFYVDLAFDSTLLRGDGLVHSSLFDLLPEGVIDNEAGQVINFGGLDETYTGQGLAPVWAKLGHVEMTAIGWGCTQIVSSMGLRRLGVLGRDPPPDSQVRFGTAAVGPPPIPTASEWGVIAMTLLVLTAGTLALMRPQPARA